MLTYLDLHIYFATKRHSMPYERGVGILFNLNSRQRWQENESKLTNSCILSHVQEYVSTLVNLGLEKITDTFVVVARSFHSIWLSLTYKLHFVFIFRQLPFRFKTLIHDNLPEVMEWSSA